TGGGGSNDDDDEDDEDDRLGGSMLASSAPQTGTLQSVAGTLLLHSNIAGSDGRMAISGDEALLKALGFAEIQSARDVVYRVGITDVHSGRTIVSEERISGSAIVGILHKNIDIQLANNFALGVDGLGTLAGGYGTFQFSGAGVSDFIVHIASGSTVLQTGANEGEIFGLSFGDASARALGVDRVSVASREWAARAVTVIDRAISTVSSRRANLGASQNRLEHTINNLTVASTNTMASESRIRDLDFAKEMMNFTRLSILSQAGSSMLAQANQIYQGLLQILR
ncbi:MAG: hypothetical protein LBQ56_05070, partial [Synergistaceae bacterium]|nr:hypothetical protein [Synergistaceae bacterium]